MDPSAAETASLEGGELRQRVFENRESKVETDGSVKLHSSHLSISMYRCGEIKIGALLIAIERSRANTTTLYLQCEPPAVVTLMAQ